MKEVENDCLSEGVTTLMFEEYSIHLRPLHMFTTLRAVGFFYADATLKPTARRVRVYKIISNNGVV